MAGPIYSLFMFKPTQAWYQLSKEEQDKLMAKVGEALDRVGGKSVLMCNSAWSNEQWLGFGVEEYPDIEAVQKSKQILLELDWYRYVEGVSLLGSKWESS